MNNNYEEILQYVAGMMGALPDIDRTEAIQTNIKQVEESFSSVTERIKERHLCWQLMRVQCYNKTKRSKKTEKKNGNPFPKNYETAFKAYINTVPIKYRMEVVLSLQISINLAVISYCRRTRRLIRNLKK